MKDLKQAASDFLDNMGLKSKQRFSPKAGSNLHFDLGQLLEVFVKHLVDKGDLMTHEDYQRFKDEYKGQADGDALCCAVADVEKEHDAINQSNEKHISNLENQVNQYQKMIDLFIHSKAKVITDEEIEKYCEMRSNKSSSHTGLRDAIDWYRDQLNKKS